MAKTTKFPRIIGINQLADETAMASEEFMFVREAVNVDIDTAGNIGRRKGAILRVSAAGFHSFYSTQRGWLMVCRYNEVGILDPISFAFIPLATMDDAYPVSYVEANGAIYVMQPNFSCMFLPNRSDAKPIGVPLPSIEPEFSVLSSGAMEAGVYGVAYSIVDPDGEESGLSEITTLTLEANQGILGNLFTLLAGYKYRIYTTTANGEILHQALEFDADTIAIQIENPEEGREAETQGLEPLSKGHILRNFGSRLLVGSTNYVYFSEPFRKHLSRPTNYIGITGFATMVESVGGGVYIGDRDGVKYYSGDDPSSWKVENASLERAFFGTSTVLPGNFFSGDLAKADEVAIWLSPVGYQAGLPGGEVVSLNSTQIRLPIYTEGHTALCEFDGRKQLVTAVNSNLSERSGAALDSVTI